MEDCVANQTLKDKSCLVPCNGLYADTVDDSLKQDMAAFEQYMQTGKFLLGWGFHFSQSGLQSLLAEMKAASYSLRKVEFPQLEFFESARGNADGLNSLKEEYFNHKKSFVKHLQFDPEAKNLSNVHHTKLKVFIFVLPAKMIEHAPLEAVYIYFETATYDEIEKDVKVKTFSEAPTMYIVHPVLTKQRNIMKNCQGRSQCKVLINQIGKHYER